MAGSGEGKRKTKSKKNRKFGRWARKPKNLSYKNSGRRDKNKKRRIEKMMRRFPNYRAPGWKLNREGKLERD